MTLTIAVIIPTYNRAGSVGEAIDSALAQTRPADEIIVVDDGSTDGTTDVLAAYGDRIRVIRQSNAGVSSARNAGIAAAASDWCAFLDSDDLWLPDRLAGLVEDAERHPSTVMQISDVLIDSAAHGRMSFFELRGFRIESPEIFERPLRPIVLPSRFVTSAAAVRTDALRAIGGFLPGLSVHEDRDVFLRASSLGPAVVRPEPGAHWRRIDEETLNLSSQTQRQPRSERESQRLVYRRGLSTPGFDSDERRAIRRRLAGVERDLAALDFAAGRPVAGRLWLLRSIVSGRSTRAAALGAPGVLAGGAWLEALARRRGESGFRRSAEDAAAASPDSSSSPAAKAS